MSFPDKTVKIGKSLPIDLHMKIVEVLVHFKDIFVWNSDDLGGIPKEKCIFAKARQDVITK